MCVPLISQPCAQTRKSSNVMWSDFPVFSRQVGKKAISWLLYGALYCDWGTLETGQWPQSKGDPYLQFIAIYLSPPSGAPLSTLTPQKHVLWPVQPLVSIADFDQGCKQNMSLEKLIFFNGTSLITVMFVSVLQPNTTFYLSKRWGSIRGVLIYIRKAVYIIIQLGIRGEILQYYKCL